MPRDIFAEQGINPNKKPPVDIFQAEGIPAPQNNQPTNPPLLRRIGADALAGYAQMGHGLINTISPELNQKDYDYGAMLGVRNPNIGDKLIQGAAQYAPYMAVPGGAVAQGAAFGATQSKDPLAGALGGGLLGGASELAPAAIKGAGSLIGKAANAFRPQKYAQQIIDSLGSGKSLQENAKSLAQDIKGGYEKAADNSAKDYAPVFDVLGDKPLYENSVNSAYKTLDKNSLNYDRNLNKVHQEFTENPTLQNAHDLQSQLGTAVRKLQKSDAKGNLSVADRSTLQGYQEAREAVKSDINNFLISKNPALAKQYQVANTNYAANVVPYLETPNIASIAKGEVTNPKNISSIFKKPEPEIQKIVEDLGAGANNKILYSEIGKLRPNLTPENLTKAFGKLENQGLDSYVTPDLSTQLATLVGKTTRRDLMQRGGGFLAGAALGHGSGIPLGEAVGAGAGAILSPLAAKAGSSVSPFIAKASQKIPINRDMLAKAIARTYGVGSKALIANAINEGQ